MHEWIKTQEKIRMASNSLGRILVVDDDLTTRLLMSETLSIQGYHVDTAASLSEMWEMLSRFSVFIILLDLQLGNDDALEALPSIVRRYPYTKVLIVTGHGSIESAVEAMKAGAYGYTTKPIQFDKLAEKLEEAVPPPSSLPVGSTDPNSMQQAGIIGASAAMRDTWNQVLRMKDVDSNVLILGESGTGKELVARALHTLSHRSNQRFEAINCGAIPAELIESELFGHKRGAFTDAKADKKGLFEICSQGTLFLDEIGELPPLQQTKLLRVLQEKEVTPIGSSHSIKIETRIIAATNRSLVEGVKKGTFREDLLFRLSVLVIHLAPLRQRKEDIPQLVQHFVEKFSQRFDKTIQAPSPDLMARLMQLDWPGNIRQLQNAIERAIVLSSDQHIRMQDIMGGSELAEVSTETYQKSPVIQLEPLTKAKENFEADYLVQLLTATKGNISEAARISGRYRADLYRLFNRYNIEPGQYKNSADHRNRSF